MNWFNRLFSDKKEEGSRAPAQPPPPLEATVPEFPFPLVPVRGAEAVTEWRRLNAAWRREGASAVLLGDAEEVANRAETLAEGSGSAEAILTLAQSRTAEEFFARRRQECGEAEDLNQSEPWPKKCTPASEVSAHLEVLSRKPKPVVYLAKLPTTRPWEIPAYLQAGGWNDCPAPEDQVIALRHWTEKYGVEIYAITDDIMECFVEHPPQTQAAALELAREQFLFCTDIVYQGVESLTLLAACLKDGSTWYFWWD